MSSNAYRWLADIDKDNMLNLSEYILAKFLIFARENSITIPRPLPQSLLDSVLELNGALVEGDDMEGEEETSHPWVINQRSLIAYRKLFSDNKTLVSGKPNHKIVLLIDFRHRVHHRKPCAVHFLQVRP